MFIKKDVNAASLPSLTREKEHTENNVPKYNPSTEMAKSLQGIYSSELLIDKFGTTNTATIYHIRVRSE